MADGNIPALAGDPPGISEAALKKAEEFIEADEGALNRLSGTAGNVATTIAVVMSLFHLYAAIAGAWPFHDFPIIATQPLRETLNRLRLPAAYPGVAGGSQTGNVVDRLGENVEPLLGERCPDDP